MHITASCVAFTALIHNVLATPTAFSHWRSSMIRRQSGPYISGPVVASNFPDPSIVNTNGTWWAFATNSDDVNIPVATSQDFKTWSVMSGMDALPNPPSWVNMAAANIWAPDVNLMADGTWVMYFSATTVEDTSKHCVGAATSDNVYGPYKATSDEPLICPLSQGGAIDASGFKDWAVHGSGWGGVTTNKSMDSWTNSSWWGGGYGGQNYIAYKVDGNSIGSGNAPNTGTCGNTIAPIVATPLMLQPVKSDGFTFDGSAFQVLNNNGLADQGVVEAPAMVKSSMGNYVLFFSRNCFNGGNYTVSYATASDVKGPYTRQGDLLDRGTDNLFAPGGMDVYWDAQHALFHADESASFTDVRQLYAAVIQINGTKVSI